MSTNHLLLALTFCQISQTFSLSTLVHDRAMLRANNHLPLFSNGRVISPCHGDGFILMPISIRKVDYSNIILIRGAARQKDKRCFSLLRLFVQGNRLSRFRFVPYKDLMPRTEALYIVVDRPAEVLSFLDVVMPPAQRRSLLRPAYLSANATYKHQFNVWNLSKWISPGSYRPGPPFFFPRRMRSWCEISLYYCAGYVRSIR